MIRNGILLLMATFFAFVAGADDGVPANGCDLPCVFESLWEEIEAQVEKDQTKLKVRFLEAVAASGDSDLIAVWEDRLQTNAQIPEPYENYALTKVSSFIDAEGWDAFFARAQSRQRPFNSGRPEMMAAAAEHLADSAIATKILTLMEHLAAADVSEAAFERSSFGHALAEAAMRRCDLEGFDRALGLTDAPGSARYTVWRTRMAGDLGSAIQKMFDVPTDDKRMNLRQILDGLTDVLVLENCATT